jgi:superfamily II DNA helicase RecQ
MEQGHYRVIVVSPEKILSDRRFNGLWESKRFTSRLFNVSFNEGHCISQWEKQFRPEYAELGRL